MMMQFNSLDFSAATHPGLKRDNNEDCFLSAPSTGLWLVADGMGGHEAGEVASAIVRDSMEQLAQQSKSFSLNYAIQAAHQAILSSAKKGIGALGMGSTVVALLSRDSKYSVAWVGDSRAYLWTPSLHGGNLTRLSIDHSYVQMLFASGAISAEEVDSHPEKNIITQCLGMQELTEVKVDIVDGQWQENQWILLCSDGLTDELSDETMAIILAENPTSVTAVEKLLHEALTSGGNDNITLQIIESPVHAPNNSITNIWNWVPLITKNRTVDAVVFATSIILLLGLLFVALL